MKTDSPSIREQAHYWYALYANDQLKGAELADFETWRAADAQHVEALAQAEFAWRRFSGEPVQASLAAAYPIDSLGRTDRFDVSPMTSALTHERKFFWRSEKLHALAASLAVIALVGLLALFVQPDSEAPRMASKPASTIYQTAVAENLTVDLVDGSRVVLDATSRLVVNEFGRTREVELLEGKAVFEVAADPTRPFAVVAGSTKVEVLGTVFDIQLEDGDAIVSVQEGRVAIKPMADQSATSGVATIELIANQRLVFDDADMRSIEPIVAGEFAAWRDGLIFYTDATLGEIVNDAARYSTGSISVDPAVRELKLTGGFQLKERDKMIRQLEEILPIKAEVDGEDVRLLSIE